MKASRVRDFAIYIAFGLCVSLLAIWSAVRDIDSKWLGFVFLTFLVFGCTVADTKRFWRLPRLWYLLAALLMLHLVGFYAALRQISELGAWEISILFMIETVGVVSICELVCKISAPLIERAKREPATFEFGGTAISSSNR